VCSSDLEKGSQTLLVRPGTFDVGDSAFLAPDFFFAILKFLYFSNHFVNDICKLQTDGIRENQWSPLRNIT